MMGLTAHRPAKRSHQDMVLDEESFRTIADLAYAESGLTLKPEKVPMVQSRLRHRLRSLGLDSFTSYCRLIHSDAGLDERRHLISALTTNVSHFFREEHHFTHLSDLFAQKLPTLRDGAAMRIWSAGCSNGQEALSIAITLSELAADIGSLDLRILATDIDPAVLSFAKEGIYADRLMGGINAQRLERFFIRNDKGPEVSFEAVGTLRALLRYNELNLLRGWPMSRPFDVIFCRNVVIYFDSETQDRLWPRFAAALRPGGFLYLGHSERIPNPEKYGFELAGPTTYRRADK